jgi:tetratricopeptide (TPR) repeat protein
MSKRDKRPAQHRPVEPPTNAQESRARVESLIASGKTREALELAKQWLKETRSAEAEALVLAAYEARIRVMLARGLYDEATALAALVGERFPAHRDRIVPLVRQSKAIAAGDLRPLLAELAAADPPRRLEIEAILTRELRDPRLLAESDALAVDEPLRRAARAVCDLFAAVTSGPLPDGALAALDQVSRHSPLAPWKLLIRALDAYYRRADGAALANLDAIPPPAAPARLVPVLRHLLGEPGAPEQRSPAAGAVIRAVTGGRTMLRPHLERLIRALAAKDGGTAVAAVERIMPLVALEPPHVKRIFAATVLWQWYRLHLNPKPLIEALRRDRRDLDWQRDTQRLIALTLERAGAWDEALIFWDGYLTAATRAGTLPAEGRAPSRVLLHMAELFPADREEVLDTFDADSEEELEAFVRDGELGEYADRGRLLARARQADPDPRVFQALVAHWETRDPRRAEAEAEAWRQAHPRDLEPLLHLVRAAERRGAHRRALDLLDLAEAINRLHPEVRQSRFRLLLASAERRIREGRFALALADLDRLDKEAATGGDIWAYLGAVRSVATRRNGDGAAAVSLHEELASRLGNPTMLALILSSVAGSFGFDPPDAPDPVSPAESVQALARSSELFRALDRPLAVPPELLAQVERELSGASSADLHSLCTGGLHMGRPGLTYAASGEGLAVDGPLRHRFLLTRGRALSAATSRRDRDRAVACLRAARELAGRARDMDAVRDASSAIDALARASDIAPWAPPAPVADTEPLTTEEIARIIKVERAHRQVPNFSAEKKAGRKRRRAPRRPQPDLFDDFAAFLEKNL